MTLGHLAYILYFHPVGKVKTCIREGGPIEQWITERGKKEMEKAASRLSVSLSESADKKTELSPLELHMVVGKRFWYMAALAVVSLLKQLDRGLVVHFYSDGSLAKEQKEALGRLPIGAVFHGPEEILKRVEKGLPKERFPNLRERFENYPNIQKLISPHVGSQGAKIVLDADVLFFGRPDELSEWQENPRGVLCATDVEENYGYPREFLERLTGGKLPRKVNVGITGLVSEKIDWDLLEKWCTELHAKQGLSYYLEQALIAMLGVKAGCTQLKKDKYITYPKAVQMQERAGTMHHYVDLSKKGYFRELWRDFI
jgi:hypothetical protein